ncbi:hypothetical protein EYF80_003299 [Liparis tanakae]|uniref:Uncharacterized protein n=1 Tax=Liparis tanakae TaxID=230148 RepID=A0A4Z2J8M6_9TELE|nr:hypothetical protein EYF80_003299 [Liparis tanakae]
MRPRGSVIRVGGGKEDDCPEDRGATGPRGTAGRNLSFPRVRIGTVITAGPCRSAAGCGCGESRHAVPRRTIPCHASEAPRGEKGILTNLFSSRWRDEIFLLRANPHDRKQPRSVIAVCGKDGRKEREKASDESSARTPGAKSSDHSLWLVERVEPLMARSAPPHADQLGRDRDPVVEIFQEIYQMGADDFTGAFNGKDG